MAVSIDACEVRQKLGQRVTAEGEKKYLWVECVGEE
jgi:hypothetical protein